MGCGKKYPTVCSYLQKITAFYSIFYFDKVMPYWVRSSSEFLHITWKTQKIVISLQQYDWSPQNLARWRRTRMWSVWLLNFNIPRWRTAAILKIDKLQYLMMMQNWSLNVSAVHRIQFLCRPLKWATHLRDIVPYFVEIIVLLQRCRNFHVFPEKCKNSLDDRA